MRGPNSPLFHPGGLRAPPSRPPCTFISRSLVVFPCVRACSFGLLWPQVQDATRLGGHLLRKKASDPQSLSVRASEGVCSGGVAWRRRRMEERRCGGALADATCCRVRQDVLETGSRSRGTPRGRERHVTRSRFSGRRGSRRASSQPRAQVTALSRLQVGPRESCAPQVREREPGERELYSRLGVHERTSARHATHDGHAPS